MSTVSKIKDTTRRVEQTLVGLASDSIWGVATSHAPFLNWPVIRQVSKYILDRLLFWLSNESIIWFNVGWVRLQLGQEWEAVENERQLIQIAMDEGASDEELAEMDEALIEAFRRAHRVGRNPL